MRLRKSKNKIMNNRLLNRKFLLSTLSLTLSLSLVITSLSSCKDDVTSSGESLIGEADKIVVGADTFGTHSFTRDVALAPDSFPIYSTPDSFLLGECDGRFGTLHADILAQFACPIDFRYSCNLYP